MKTMVQVFVTSCPDYCNALCYGTTEELKRRLQSVQNAPARLVTGTSQCDHISRVLCQLHWPPMWQHVVFRIATVVHCVCPAMPQVTWLTTVRSSPTPVSDNGVLPTLEHSSVRRDAVCHRRITSLEQSAAQSPTVWGVIWPVQAVTENIYIQTVRPRCNANCF